MSILEGLGPKKKMFEDLEPGDYVFEISEPGEKGWTHRYTSDDDPDVWMEYVDFRLRVVSPEESAGRLFFHSIMFNASPEKIAQAKKPYDPSTFLYQFFGEIGAGMIQSGELTILDDYLTDGELDLDKFIGLRFAGSLRAVKSKKDNSKEYVNLTKAWPE